MNYFISEYIKNGLDSKGRTSRKSYWYAVLWYFLISTLVGSLFGIIDYLIYGKEYLDIIVEESKTNKVLFSDIGGSIFSLVFFIPSIFLSIRRLHDINKSGWWLLTIIPPFILAFFKGDEGENKYGKNPLNEEVSIK